MMKVIDELCSRGRGRLLLRGDGAFSLGQRISKLGLKSHHIITSAPEYILCNKRVVAALGINLTAVFFGALPQRWKLWVQHLPGYGVRQSPGIRHRLEGSKLCRLPINGECNSYFDIQHFHAMALASRLELAVYLNGTSASCYYAATVPHGKGLAMAASPNLGTSYSHSWTGLPSFFLSSSRGGWRSIQHSSTHSIKQQTHQLTSQPGNHAGIVDPQVVVDRPPPESPWGTIRPGAPRVKWLGRL